MDEEVTRTLNLTEEDIARPHDQRQTELEYRLAWARTYLKGYGLITNTGRGIWVVTPKGNETEAVNPAHVERYIGNKGRNDRQEKVPNQAPTTEALTNLPDAEALLEQNWREELINVVLALTPVAFERLCQRLLLVPSS